MIQRIQSIWLLLAAAAIFLLMAVPTASASDGAEEFLIRAIGLYHTKGEETLLIEIYKPLLITTVAVGVLCLANIFNYRKRGFQKRVCLIAIVMIMALSALIFNAVQQIPGGAEKLSYEAGIALPILSIVFCILAFRGIRKDEQLLKSADRLR